MIQFLTSRWTYAVIRAVGFGFFVVYLVFTGDWRISALWAVAFPVIAFSIAWLFVLLKLFDRLPKLNRYLLYPPSKTEPRLSENEWTLAKANYLESGFRGKALLFTAAEDGLICVPILLIGIAAIPAACGGVVFGLLHLGRFTYLECIGKAITYTLVCYFVLPYGLVTVAVGHFIMDALGLAVIKVAKHKLSGELRSNPTVERDGRQQAGARPSP